MREGLGFIRHSGIEPIESVQLHRVLKDPVKLEKIDSIIKRGCRTPLRGYGSA